MKEKRWKKKKIFQPLLALSKCAGIPIPAVDEVIKKVLMGKRFSFF